MNKQQFEVLKSKISSFCKINFFQISLETKQSTGLFCSSHSFIRKHSAIERVKTAIEEMKLPYSVTESGLELNNGFIIKF